MIKGRCLCEEVKYEYNGRIEEVAICHCKQCKRAQGTPFATNAPLETARFSVTQGASLLKAYNSSPNKKRVFCSQCGSPLYSQRTDMPETIRLRLGSVTDGQIPAPGYEIYGESKSDWFHEDAERPCYDQNKL